MPKRIAETWCFGCGAGARRLIKLIALIMDATTVVAVLIKMRRLQLLD